MNSRGAIVFFIAAAVLLTLGHHWHSHAQTATLSGQVRVIDGDTIEMGDVRIRLAAIDAPEADQACDDERGKSYPCGLLATILLQALIGDRAVTCFPSGTDHYGRTLASCSVDGQDLGDMMVRRGMAIAYLRYSTKYQDAEIEARRAHRGLWSGTFVEPEIWRHRR